MFDMNPEPKEQQVNVEEQSSEENELQRIRVLISSPEPIATKSGEELMLEEGDVQFVDTETAAWLIESGVAEDAAL